MLLNILGLHGICQCFQALHVSQCINISFRISIKITCYGSFTMANYFFTNIHKSYGQNLRTYAS